MTDFAEQLRAVAFDGRWSPEEVLHAMPLLFHTYLSGEDVRVLADEQPAVRRLLAGLADRLGPVDSADALTEKIRAHYAEHPVDSLLLRTLKQCFRTLLTTREASHDARKLLGETARPTTPAPPSGPTVRAGPTARFSAVAITRSAE